MRLAISTALFLLLTAGYLSLSGAPLRVHVLNVLCFAISFWVPASLASTLTELRRRWLPCVLLVLAGMLLWDGTKSVVILKAGSLDILRGAPWIYVVGLVVLGGLVALSAWLGSRMARVGTRSPKEA